MFNNLHIETVETVSSADPQKRWRAFAALRLASIGSSPDPSVGRIDYLNQFLGRQIDFIAMLPSIGSASALEIRLCSSPVADAPQRGEIAVSVRLVASGEDAAQASDRLREAIDCIWPSLVTISDAYQWRPVVIADEYEALFDSIESNYIAEIVRREAQLPLDRLQALPRKRTIGLTGAGTSDLGPEPSQSDIYYVFPYVRTYSTLATLCNVLLMGPNPIGISLAIEPTRLREDEVKALRRELERCEVFLGHVPHYASDGSYIGAPLRHRAQKLLAVLHEQTFSLLDDCFHLRTSVFSAQPISAGVIETLGTTISESVASHDPYSDARIESHNLMGGCEWAQAEDDAQREVASSNLKVLDFQTWVPTLARQGSERLRYLADARQANSVFRMPVPLKGSFPGVNTRLARLMAPPRNLPEEGLCLGDNNYRGISQPINLLRDDRRRHMYIVGQTGTGKSTLLSQMVRQDIENGSGVCLIDPHGELVDEVLGCIPPGRIDDVVHIDPADTRRTVGLNLLEFRDSLDRDSAINHLLEIFEQLYNMRVAGGPVFEQYLRYSALLATTTSDSNATLADISRVFADRQYRDEMLAHSKDPLLKSFWSKIATKVGGDHSLENMSNYITSKFTRIAANSLMRQIILQRKSTVDFLDCMQGRKIVLVDLAKGRLGSTNSRFLGMILMSLLTRAAFARSETSSADDLRDFYVYVDEFQNLATDSFSMILSEARKYRLNLIVSNQYMHQIPEELQEAVTGNVGTMLSFRAGMQDAQILEARFSGRVSRDDLMSLENYHAYLVTLYGGEATPAFDLETREPIGLYDAGIARKSRLLSKRKYTKPRTSVERAIAESFET